MASGLRVAVTGAAGSIGSKLVGRLVASDDVDRVLAFDARPVMADHPKLVSFQQDIRQPIGDVLHRHGVDALVHLAFLLRPGRNREVARRVNVNGTAELLRSCRAAGVRHLLYLSSTTVYGARADDPQPYTEESPVHPVRGFRYGEDKAATESMFDALAADNPDICVTILRSCPVVGPRSENAAARALRMWAGVRTVGADPPMQFVHEDDLQDALEICVAAPVAGVFNVAGRDTVPYSELARVAGRRSVALPVPVLSSIAQATWALRLQGEAPASGLAMMRWPWVASTERIAREMGFRPRYTSREALEASTLARGQQVTPR